MAFMILYCWCFRTFSLLASSSLLTSLLLSLLVSRSSFRMASIFFSYSFSSSLINWLLSCRFDCKLLRASRTPSLILCLSSLFLFMIQEVSYTSANDNLSSCLSLAIRLCTELWLSILRYWSKVRYFRYWSWPSITLKRFRIISTCNCFSLRRVAARRGLDSGLPDSLQMLFAVGLSADCEGAGVTAEGGVGCMLTIKIIGSCYNDMRRQTKFSTLRDNLQKEARRSNLNKIFKENRLKMLEEARKQDKEEFDLNYPNIDEDNFSQYLPFVAKFSQHPDYNFRMLPFAPYLYDYLLDHPSDPTCLDILENLSQFEEVEVPQTEELASLLIMNLKEQCRAVLTIIGNLLQHSKYISGLRDYLIEGNFVELGQENIATQNLPKQTIDLLFAVYFQILVIIVTTHPAVETPIFEHCLATIVKHLNKNDPDLVGILFDRLEGLASSLLEDERKAHIIISSLGPLMLKEYFNYEWEVVGVLLYCLKSKVAVSPEFHPLLAKSLTSSQEHLKDKVILSLDLIQDSKDLNHLVNGYPDFVPDLIRTFHISASWTKIKIVGLLQKLISIFLGEDESEMTEETGRIDLLLQICTLVREALEGTSPELKHKAVDLLFGLFSALEENPEGLEAVFSQLEQQRVFELLGSLVLSEEAKKKGDCILAWADARKGTASSV